MMLSLLSRWVRPRLKVNVRHLEVTVYTRAQCCCCHKALDLLDLWDSPGVLAHGGRKVLVYAPGDAGPWFDARVPTAFALQPQAEGNLGRRMAGFFADEFEDGATRVVLIGSDAPTLDPSFVI